MLVSTHKIAKFEDVLCFLASSLDHSSLFLQLPTEWSISEEMAMCMPSMPKVVSENCGYLSASLTTPSATVMASSMLAHQITGFTRSPCRKVACKQKDVLYRERIHKDCIDNP